MVNSFSIKTIIFDIGGVIVNSFGKELIDFASETLGIEPKELRKLMDKYEPTLQKGQITHVVFWKKVINEKGASMPADDVLKTLWVKPYEDNVKIDFEMVSLIKLLKKNYTVGCISNSIKPHTVYNKNRGLYNLFDPCLLSDEVRMRKPDKEIFELYLEKSGCNPQEAVFVDDEAPLLVNARVMGINTIVFINIEQLKKELAVLNIKI